MRLAVFVFTIMLFVATSMQAYALPHAVILRASVGHAAMLLTNGAKNYKMSGGQALTVMGGALYAYCKSNKATCKEIGGELVETLIPDDDDMSETCMQVTMYNLNYRAKQFSGDYGDAYDEHGWYRDDVAIMSQIQAEYNQLYNTSEMREKYPLVNSQRFPPQDNYSSVVNSQQFKQDFANNCSRLELGQYAVTAEFANGKKVAGADGFTEWYYRGHIAAYKTTREEREEEKERKRQENEKKLLDLMKDKIDDDQMTHIVNNYGDKIDIDYCVGTGACSETNDTDITNNDNDTTKNDNDKTTVKKDDDDTTNNTGGTGTGAGLLALGFCEWAKPVCDFIAGSVLDDNPQELPVDEQRPLDPAGFDQNYLSYGGQCPSLGGHTIAVGNVSTVLTFDMSPLCMFAEKVRPAIIAMAYLGAMYIVSSAIRG